MASASPAGSFIMSRLLDARRCPPERIARSGLPGRWGAAAPPGPLPAPARSRRAVPVQPRLEHQDVPEVVLPVPLPGEVLRPLLPDRQRIEEAFPPEPVLVEKRLCP